MHGFGFVMLSYVVPLPEVRTLVREVRKDFDFKILIERPPPSQACVSLLPGELFEPRDLNKISLTVVSSRVCL